MITSDKQYEAAKEQLQMLEQSLVSPAKNAVPTLLETAAKSQIQELINEIKANMDEYIKLINNNDTAIAIHSFDDLLLAPIRYRLATQMTIESFGLKVGVSPRQIARYEKEEYQNINTTTLKKILRELEVSINGEITQQRQKANRA